MGEVYGVIAFLGGVWAYQSSNSAPECILKAIGVIAAITVMGTITGG